MDWAGWAIFGLIATTSLTAVMVIAQVAGLSRLDIPLLLGTMVSDDPDRAHVAGIVMHLFVGQGFALGYAAVFVLVDHATWWLGGALGLLHGLVALTIIVPFVPVLHRRMASSRAGPASPATLEPPGLFALNYGVQTPAIALVAHLLFGVALGVLLRLQ